LHKNITKLRKDMQIFINKTLMKLLLHCISSAFKIDCIYLIFYKFLKLAVLI